MLPDFPDAKNCARRTFLRAVRSQMPTAEPILEGIRHSRIHEGRTAKLTRADQSTDQMVFHEARAEVMIGRELMRRVSVEQLLQHVATMAEQLAGHQVALMVSRISEAVEKVGNTVSATELGTKEAFLESQRKLEVEFDPQTLEPKSLVILMHPDQVERFKAQAAEWEKDPAFTAEMRNIRQQQLEEWRARENRRKLAD